MEPFGPIPVEKEYPGIEFFPPDGVIGPKETEGELLVKWKKVGDKYTMVSIDDRPISTHKIPMTKEEVENKKERMRHADAFREIDQMARLYPS